MFTLRVVRHDRHEQVLAECQSLVAPVPGESLELETMDATGTPTHPGTLWRIVAVTVHVPSSQSSAPAGGGPLAVRLVEVAVLPDGVGLPGFSRAEHELIPQTRR